MDIHKINIFKQIGSIKATIISPKYMHSWYI